MDRASDLDKTLTSVFNSSVLPKKLIIVDDSSDGESKCVVDKWKHSSDINGTTLVYVHPDQHSGGSGRARNIGLSHISDDDDIIMFLDDDVSLDEKYIEIILQTFLDCPEICGAQGCIEKNDPNGLKKCISYFVNVCLLFIYHRSTYSPIVTKTMANRWNILVPKSGRVRRSQWLSGCNMAYQANIFRANPVRFDEQLILSSLGEDLDLSYSLHKRGKILVINYDAKLVHRLSQQARRPKMSLLLMEFGYQRYLICKHVSAGVLGDLLYQIWVFKRILRYAINGLVHKDFQGVKESFSAYRIVKNYAPDIKNCDLKDLNHKIVKTR